MQQGSGCHAVPILIIKTCVFSCCWLCQETQHKKLLFLFIYQFNSVFVKVEETFEKFCSAWLLIWAAGGFNNTFRKTPGTEIVIIAVWTSLCTIPEKKKYMGMVYICRPTSSPTWLCYRHVFALNFWSNKESNYTLPTLPSISALHIMLYFLISM